MKPKINADIIGIGASIACAIHCAVLPLFLTGLSVFGVNIIHNFWFETGMILLAGSLGYTSLRHGFITSPPQSGAVFAIFHRRYAFSLCKAILACL